jgi:glycosyltransferase involved in cell wall biosynthesis
MTITTGGNSGPPNTIVGSTVLVKMPRVGKVKRALANRSAPKAPRAAPDQLPAATPSNRVMPGRRKLKQQPAEPPAVPARPGGPRQLSHSSENPVAANLRHSLAALDRTQGSYRDDLSILQIGFDHGYYRATYPEVAEMGYDALAHYCTIGWMEGRDPAPWFSTARYLELHEDVLAAGWEPFCHYLRFGRHEKRLINDADIESGAALRRNLSVIRDEFDSRFYRTINPELNFTFISPEMHFLLAGWRQKRDPAPWFSVDSYLTAYPDVRAACLNPFVHFIDWGRTEGRQPNREVRKVIEPLFDSQYYLEQRPPLGGLEPIEHFIAFGWREGFNPCRKFSVDYYLRLYPDVAKARCNPLYHYAMFGRNEGRSTQPSTARQQSVRRGAPAILFVGHDGRRAGAQIVLLELVRWVADHTRHPIKVLLLAPGPLAADYARYADLLVMTGELGEYIEDPELAQFVAGPIAAVYINTAAATKFWTIYDRLLAMAQVPAILHIHELANVMAEYACDFHEMQRRARCIIAVSEAVRCFLIEGMDCSPDKLFLSNAFIRPLINHLHEIGPARLAARSTLRIGEQRFVVIGCGSVDQRKGADLFLETARKAIAGHPAPAPLFVWIGEGPELDQLRQSVAAFGLDAAVQFVGARTDAAHLIAAADVFLLTSREDPFPTVCLEAAQYGIPIVFFEGGTGIGEFVQQDAGCAVPSLNTDACCRVIRALANQPFLRQQLGSTARSRVMAGYTAELRAREIALHVLQAANIDPSVSIVVPTYNHERYISERIESILQQTIQDFEVLVLDDCSADSTVAIVERYADDPRVRLVRSAVNSGFPFGQWQRGLAACRSDLVWIAEGDDACGGNLLESLLPAFDEPATSIAFCRSEVIDENGISAPAALDDYLSQSDFPFQQASVRMEGVRAVQAGFGAICLIVNASSTILRKNSVVDSLEQARQFKICGDWYVYLSALKRGELYYTRSATNYFRRHPESVVHRLEGTPAYFLERFQISQFIVENFPVSRQTLRAMLAVAANELLRFRDRNPGLAGKTLYDDKQIMVRFRASSPRPRLRVGFYVHGLLFSRGGIERIFTEVANELVRRGHSVVVFCRIWGATSPVYRLSPSVEVVAAFDEDNINQSIAGLRLAVARRDLDVFVPMLSEWLFDPLMDAVAGLGMPVIVSEHNDPWKIEELWWTREKRLACFRRADAIHLLLDRFRNSIPDDLLDRVVVIPNGIRIDNPVTDAPAQSRPKRIIGVGRLEPQKRFDRLIKAFSSVHKEHPDYRLDIFGEGQQRGQLQRLIVASGLADAVSLPGIRADIADEYAKSSIFVLPSQFEGFSIVLLEAKMAGLPCIAYQDCNGPNDLVRHGEDGLLVASDDDGRTLAQALCQLIPDPALRSRMAINARANLEQYSLGRIADRWEELLYATVSGRRPGAHPVPIDLHKQDCRARPLPLRGHGRVPSRSHIVPEVAVE